MFWELICLGQRGSIGSADAPSLQPAAPPEIQHGQRRAGNHQKNALGVAVFPLQLGHVLEVHAIDAGDQRGRQQGHAGHGKELDDLVLIDVDEADGASIRKLILSNKKVV